MKAKIGMEVRGQSADYDVQGKIITMTVDYCIIKDEEDVEYCFEWCEIGAVVQAPKQPTV